MWSNFFPTLLIPNFQISTYLNHLKFYFYFLHQILMFYIYLFIIILNKFEVVNNDVENATKHSKIM